MSTRPRHAGITYGILTIVLLVLLGALTLTSRQPPPPSIAEFAPQAVDNIVDAPTDQSSGSGTDGGAGSSADGAGAGPAPTPQTVARARRCVGDPPRQIEDPQSPPCVPYWTGDNGGATSKGVTRDEIRITETHCPFAGTPSARAGPSWREDFLRNFSAFFNTRFEFYGRKLKVGGVSGGGTDDDAAMKADAVKVDEEQRAFANFAYCDKKGKEFVFYDELARLGIISINNRSTFATEAHYASKHPYEWSYLPPSDLELTNLGAFACSALKGRPAAYARGPERGRPRVFGIMNQARATDMFAGDIEPLRKAMADCGIQAPVVGADDNGVLRLKADGVTTVMFIGDGQPGGATTQGWFPEWVASTYWMFQDFDLAGQITQAFGQMDATFGTYWFNKQHAVDQEPWNWAVQEMEPGYVYEGPPAAYYDGRVLYYSMLVLASGIQMAGPRLTPVTFAKGLQATTFPNPGAGTAPHYQARIGFGPRDHTAQDDAAIVWWSGSHESQWGSTGTLCYLNGGTRHSIGRTPFPTTDAGLFAGACN